MMTMIIMLIGLHTSIREKSLLLIHRVEVQCSTNLNTYDLETEIFLHIVQNCQEFVQVIDCGFVAGHDDQRGISSQ